jgi:hypothetical protein
MTEEQMRQLRDQIRKWIDNASDLNVTSLDDCEAHELNLSTSDWDVVISIEPI